uniref:HAD family hydrolase n=1 Tax=Acetatifactor sp. TaxID=1872090 RepID=UPI004055DD17
MVVEEQRQSEKDRIDMKKAVVFDLDGTLSDSIQSIKYCADEALKPLGYGPFSVEQYKYFVGDGAANLIKRALLAGGDEELVHFEEAFERYKELFRVGCMYEVKPYDGICELLASLKAKNIRIAVLSNKPHAETIHVIETMFGKGYFDVIQGQKDDVAIKPSPEGVFQIMEQLSLKTEEILYLGDTATDMKTGKSAGAFTVGALWGFRERKELEESHADAIIEHPLQLLDFL